MASPFQELLRETLLNAAPGQLLDVATEMLSARVSGVVRCWLADQQEAVMLSVAGPEVDNAEPELLRVFASQLPAQRQADHRSVAMYWPLSVRGARLGVLEVQFPEPPGHGVRSLLAQAAQTIAQAVIVATPLTDTFHQLRRIRPLTVAAEMQWALLPPATSYSEESVQLGAALEPAYTVSGDCFDFSRDGDHVDVAVFDGAGRGVAASIASTVTVSAYRNARRAGLPLPEQASLADQALFSHFSGTQYVAALLLRLDLKTGRLEVVDAGSPKVLRMRGNDCNAVTFDAQMPLGMFEETIYTAQYAQLEPGDRLVVVGDGVHAAESIAQETFSARALPAAARETRLLGAAESARHIIRQLHHHLAGTPLATDAVVVCVDWTPPVTVSPTTPLRK
jgi:serine phosphatase RsbU (regulator of sigma subunit)